MEMTRWRPFGELDSLERRMRRLFAEAGIAPAPLPAADVYETDGAYVVELEAPGFDEQDLAVETAEHALIVKGERSQATDEHEKTYELHERLERSFERRFVLPVEADMAKLEASFDKGVLRVRAPKVALTQPRKVAIGASA